MSFLWRILCSQSRRRSPKATHSVVCLFFVTTFLLYVAQDMAWHTDVVNGELNKLFLTIENKTGKNVTLHSVAGEFLDPTSDQLIKAVCALPWHWDNSYSYFLYQANNLTYGIDLPDTTQIQLPYSFHSESVHVPLWRFDRLMFCTGSEPVISNSEFGWSTSLKVKGKEYPPLIPSLLSWSPSSLSSILSCTSLSLQCAWGNTQIRFSV